MITITYDQNSGTRIYKDGDLTSCNRVTFSCGLNDDCHKKVFKVKKKTLRMDIIKDQLFYKNNLRKRNHNI